MTSGQPEKEEYKVDLLSEYARFLDVGTINYLVTLMAREEGKSKRKILEELGISRGTLYQPHVGNDVKQRIIKEALKRLNKTTVIKILYSHMRDLFNEFIVDVLSEAYDELDTNDNLAEFVKEVLTETSGLLQNVRDIERRKIIEIVKNRIIR